MIEDAVATTLTRTGKGDAGRVRVVLADLLAFLDRKYGDGHALTCDTLAAMAHHEFAVGEMADDTVRKNAVRRSVWSYAVRRPLPGELANLEVGFEPEGKLHLAPTSPAIPAPAKVPQLETILNQAVDDLYARPGDAGVRSDIASRAAGGDGHGARRG